MNRILGILCLLAGGVARGPEALAGRFGVSKRRIYHDLRLLRDVGIQVVCDQTGYRLLTRGLALPVHLSDDELLSLLYARDGAGAANVPVWQSAQLKLVAALTPALRALFRRSGWRHVGPAAAPLELRILERVHGSLAEHRKLLVRYASASSPSRERVLHPHGLFCRGSGWYLVAWAPERAELREFRLDRIEWAKVLEERFDPVDGFDISAYASERWGLWRGPEVEAWIRVQPSHLGYVRSDPRLHGLPLRRLPGGGGEFRIPKGHPDEIAWWVLQYAGGMEVVEPESLRRRIAELAARIAALHAPGEGEGSPREGSGLTRARSGVGSPSWEARAKP